MQASRLPQLDAIRGLAAVLVLAYHVRLILGVDLVPGPVAAGGSSGVGIFFVLSGYLLFRPFLYGRVDLRAYAVRRVLRVWPAYLLALAGCALLLGVSAPAEAPLLFATMAQNYDPSQQFRIVGVSWTLTIEVAFYATVPLLAWFIRRRPIHRQIPTLLWIGTASLLGHFAAVLLTAVMPATAWRLTVVDFYPFMLWAFVPGMVLAILDARGIRLRHPLVLLAGAACLAIGIGFHPQRLDVPTAVGTMLLIGWALTRDVSTTTARLASALGAISFALYLWHYDVLQWASGLGLDRMFAAAIGVSVAIAIAIASYLLVERPAIRFARALTAPNMRSNPQAVATTPAERAATAAAPSS
jgi:peptidoglycan/LPS O-acetylase OafA/YrhL